MYADTYNAQEIARLALEALEFQRMTDDVDEWPETDPRSLAYRAAWEVLGEDEAGRIMNRIRAEIAG